MCAARQVSQARPKPAHLAAPGGAHPADPTSDQVAAAVASFAMLADPTRVRLLWALRDSEQDVSSLATAAGTSPNTTSQHLAKLRLTGLVSTRRDGRRVYYELRGGHVRTLLREALFHADHQISGAPIHD
ncbi:MAG TPA: metalloregulator ArsR/SmtB family transcription factor [Mycobacteriales bacterium]|jgi:DNA-binding transcriptional ArsR family regulator|nr:metalloregulator ArsR/SmtB family transcription factor [Mycobacteriales bacterium]